LKPAKPPEFLGKKLTVKDVSIERNFKRQKKQSMRSKASNLIFQKNLC
jgi:hypothetical protein